MITRKTKESLERINAQKNIRNCKDKYLIYFTYTTLKITPGGYKEDPKPQIITIYDVYSSDKLDDIRKHENLLLSIMSEDNSYILVIVDRSETKIIKKSIRLVKFDTIFEKNNIKVPNRINIEYNYDLIKKDYKKVYPNIGYNIDNKLSELDFFFRGPSEVPEDYKWDTGEYEGWLQFRWGDGLNAINKDGKE